MIFWIAFVQNLVYATFTLSVWSKNQF